MSDLIADDITGVQPMSDDTFEGLSSILQILVDGYDDKKPEVDKYLDRIGVDDG